MRKAFIKARIMSYVRFIKLRGDSRMKDNTTYLISNKSILSTLLSLIETKFIPQFSHDYRP